ncbi:hypothetical protein TrLO_g754 [Triparma laevis f. longispina]|uniref:Uncharacterized protein n=1 Tax=Triparma laevis f. longispina TaxID=1714387 RepID=A0A9W7F1P6_9STRA|nr:hypothetical protein TrLO_g754 [Triparma laevis f. longispina]
MATFSQEVFAYSGPPHTNGVPQDLQEQQTTTNDLQTSSLPTSLSRLSMEESLPESEGESKETPMVSLSMSDETIPPAPVVKKPANPYSHLGYENLTSNPYAQQTQIKVLTTPQSVVEPLQSPRAATPLPPINSFSRTIASPFKVIATSPSPHNSPSPRTSPPLRQLNIDKMFSSNSKPSVSNFKRRLVEEGPSSPKRTRLMSVQERQEILEEEFDYRYVDGLGK